MHILTCLLLTATVPPHYSRSYVGNLTKLVEEYVRPLLAHTNLGLRPDQVTAMFSNVEIVASFHQMFLADLESSEELAKPFLKFGDFLKMYTQYLNDYARALATIDACRTNKRFQAFLQAKREVMGTDLMSLLILPVQRIPRYEMLLRELKKYTPPDHPELAMLEKAFAKIVSIACHVNEDKRQVENMSKLLEVQSRINPPTSLLQPSRQLLMEGLLHKKTGNIMGSIHRRYFFLFSDIILWCNPEATKFKGMMNLQSCAVHPYQNAKAKHSGFELRSPQKSLTILAQSQDEHDTWQKALQDAVDKLHKATAATRQARSAARSKKLNAIRQKHRSMRLGGGSERNDAVHNKIANSLAALKRKNQTYNAAALSAALNTDGESDGSGPATPGSRPATPRAGAATPPPSKSTLRNSRSTSRSISAATK